jgi:methionine-rich copper-binding protein CopC
MSFRSPIVSRRVAALAALALLAVATTAVTAPAAPAADALRRHVRLVRSEPARDSVVRVAPTEIRLWFSETLDLAVTRVQLTDGTRQQVRLKPITRAEGADAPIVAAAEAPLADGNYMVTWTTSSKDGHPMRGTFRFTVRATP